MGEIKIIPRTNTRGAASAKPPPPFYLSPYLLAYCRLECKKTLLCSPTPSKKCGMDSDPSKKVGQPLIPNLVGYNWFGQLNGFLLGCSLLPSVSLSSATGCLSNRTPKPLLQGVSDDLIYLSTTERKENDLFTGGRSRGPADASWVLFVTL